MESERAVGDRYRKLLSPLAAKHGLSYDIELLEPGNDAAQNAFHFVYCGASLLSFFTEPDGFPSEGKRVKKRGAKWMRRDFGNLGGQEAAIFLAQALAIFLAEMTKQHGHSGDADISLYFRDLIQKHYPLNEAATDRLEECRTEFRTRETFEVRPDVARTKLGGTGYHLALLDRGFLDGMHPEEDPQMVDAQKRHASQYLRGKASLAAIEMVLGPKRFSSVQDDLFPVVGPSWEALSYDLQSLTWWGDVAKEWRRFGQIAIAD